MTDYRQSHIAKGATYDEGITSEPLSAYMSKWELRHLRCIVDRHFPEKVPLYLDFACGTGRITSVMETLAAQSHAVDISSQMVAFAKAKCTNTRFIVGDITRDTLDLPRINLVTAFRFFGNAEDELRQQVLLRLRNLLLHDGYLILNNHRNPRSIINRMQRAANPPRLMDLDRVKLVTLLRATGFRIVGTYGIGAWIFRGRIASDRRLLDSRFGDVMERLSVLPGIAGFCPDMIVIAQKR